MDAEVVATPVLERLHAGAATGVVRGATERAAYLDLGGFVVALTAPGVPLMPNGIAVPRTAVPDGPVRAAPGRIDAGAYGDHLGRGRPAVVGAGARGGRARRRRRSAGAGRRDRGSPERRPGRAGLAD